MVGVVTEALVAKRARLVEDVGQDMDEQLQLEELLDSLEPLEILSAVDSAADDIASVVGRSSGGGGGAGASRSVSLAASSPAAGGGAGAAPTLAASSPSVAKAHATCGVCGESSATRPWNRTQTFNKGTPREIIVPMAYACRRCARGAMRGQFGLAWGSLKKKCIDEPSFKEDVKSAGDCAEQNEAPVSQPRMPQEVGGDATNES